MVVVQANIGIRLGSMSRAASVAASVKDANLEGRCMTKLAEQLTALMEYRNRPDHYPEPVTSSFVAEPANDNTMLAKAEGLTGEKSLRTIPSIVQIDRESRNEPVRNSKGQIVSIGSLRFSDGTQTEKAFMRGPDGDTIQYDRRMPRGAMLGTKETLVDGASGASGGVAIPNSFLCHDMMLPNHPFVPGSNRRPGKAMNAKQSRANLDKAIANTPVMPPVTVFPPGIAAGTAQFSDQFVGMKIGSTGKGGAPSWVDIFMAGEEQKEERKAHDELSMKDKAVLRAMLDGGSFADVGIAAGQSPLYAKYNGGGKRALKAANDNYAINLQKSGS